ncbi:phosphonate ABC transporter ATP-binding protein [Telmatospirillum sp.]|uniref:phosphonate ABC transporter ATP-binding protein n=1 Tax=Telmatospirillum sp. TaxID=2079197 RepID=UPI002848C149|nr:phosphonate ABC transporter ATP-binding protein [Telmatospirillum sp.]MDR3440884.1 phosphonate ABC transporter ATP-binding protein [Telmatospirillum sp.]
MSAVRITDLSKSFRGGCRALDAVTLSIGPAEMVALIGASGSGKSTLLRHIAGLIDADRHAGEARIDILGQVMQSGGRLSRHCRRIRAEVGFVFQQFNLVSRLSVMTNVLLGTLGRIPRWRGCLGLFSAEERNQALDALRRVGIADVALQRASTLSGGQQQRAAIARTLVQRAKLILADEPIASLDPASAVKVMDALATINREDGITVLVSLHQVDYAIRYCPRTIAMLAGRVVYDGPSSALTPAFLNELYGSESKDLLLGPKACKPADEAPYPAELAYVR